MNYIVLDLEWNQSTNGGPEMPGIPFEIIEIGAIKLNEDGSMLSEFSKLIKPSVYMEMHRVTSRLIHLQIPYHYNANNQLIIRIREGEGQTHYILDLTRQYHNLLMSEDDAERKEQIFYWDANVPAAAALLLYINTNEIVNGECIES